MPTNLCVVIHPIYLFCSWVVLWKKKTLPRVEGHYRRCSRASVEHCSCTSTTRFGTDSTTRQKHNRARQQPATNTTHQNDRVFQWLMHSTPTCESRDCPQLITSGDWLNEQRHIFHMAELSKALSGWVTEMFGRRHQQILPITTKYTALDVSLFGGESLTKGGRLRLWSPFTGHSLKMRWHRWIAKE